MAFISIILYNLNLSFYYREQKNGRQKNADTKMNNLPQDEDATGQSSGEHLF
jgi:hypothetical protein